MSIYTKTGDGGTTKLMKIQNVSKSDDRIQLLGTIDELTSNLGVAKSMEMREDIRFEIERIQQNLMTIMAGVADQYNKEHKMSDEEVAHLEKEINKIEESFPREKRFVLPGDCELSARYDVARTITRRAERCLTTVDRKYDADSGAKKYMNRLADFIYMLARQTDYLFKTGGLEKANLKAENNAVIGNAILQDTNSGKEKSNMSSEQLVNSVLQKLGFGMNKIDLATAKSLIQKIEEESLRRGLNAVIAICNPEGNPVAIHVMDDAFLASFDIALKKAYTSVAVKMSTKELGKLAMPGETFYGIDKADNGRMIIFGGGIPLVVDGKIVGGLGVSGGTSEQDSDLAEYGIQIFEDIVKK